MNTYSKSLVGRKNPENLCFTNVNELLVMASKKDKMKGRLRKGDHFFVGVETGEPAQYGWVKTLDQPMSAEQLAKLKWSDPTDEQLANCELLLASASKQADETPMACHFVEIVSPQGKRTELKIHKVFFYEHEQK